MCVLQYKNKTYSAKPLFEGIKPPYKGQTMRVMLIQFYLYDSNIETKN